MKANNGSPRHETYIQEIILKMREILSFNPDQFFFFCSDDREFKKKFLKEFPASLIILNSCLVGEVQKDKEFQTARTKHPYKYRSKESVQDAVVEAWLLSQTNYHDRLKLDLYSGFTRLPLLIKNRILPDRGSNSVT